MPAFHLLRCNVALGGDHGNTVYRDRTRPIVFPELPLLQFIHGEEAITEIHVVGQWNTTNAEVLERLRNIYDPDVLKEVFPGAQPRLPMSDASVPRCTLPIYQPKPVRPDSPDPRLRPLDQFTVTADMPVLDAPVLPSDDEPTPDEIAAHAQDEAEPEDEAALGLAGPPDVRDLPFQIHPDSNGRISSRRAQANPPGNLPDVAGGMGTGHEPRDKRPRG